MSSQDHFTTPCSTNTTDLPLVLNIIKKNGYEYALETFNEKYYLLSLVGSDLPAKTVAKSAIAIDAAITAFEEDMAPQPDPTPAAPAIVVREQVLIPAVAASTTERTIKIVAPEIIGACDGFMARHFNLPKELQDEPARYYQPGGIKKFCPACYIAYMESMGHYDQMQAEAAAEPQYVAVPKVAA